MIECVHDLQLHPTIYSIQFNLFNAVNNLFPWKHFKHQQFILSQLSRSCAFLFHVICAYKSKQYAPTGPKITYG